MDRLRDARKQMGYTMKFVAEKIGVTESAISQYENGRRQPDFEIASKLADVLCVSVDYLLGRDEETEESLRRAAINMLGSNQRYIAEALPKLNEDQAKAIRAIIDQMDIK